MGISPGSPGSRPPSGGPSSGDVDHEPLDVAAEELIPSALDGAMLVVGILPQLPRRVEEVEVLGPPTDERRAPGHGPVIPVGRPEFVRPPPPPLETVHSRLEEGVVEATRGVVDELLREEEATRSETAQGLPPEALRTRSCRPQDPSSPMD